jgi:hypothetical protein
MESVIALTLLFLTLAYIGYWVVGGERQNVRDAALRKQNPERHDRWLATRDDRGSDMGNGM